MKSASGKEQLLGQMSTRSQMMQKQLDKVGYPLAGARCTATLCHRHRSMTDTTIERRFLHCTLMLPDALCPRATPPPDC